MVGLGVNLADMPDYVSHNALGTAILLSALHEHPVGRLVLASSMVVYGEGRYSCAEHGSCAGSPRSEASLRAGEFEVACPHCGAALEPEPISEDAPCEPRNVYAATKLHQEHLAAVFTRETGTPVTSLRYHNVYGPRMPRSTPYAGAAALFTDALASGRSPRVFEDGAQLRDFIHVHDIARANVLALTVAQAVAGPLNVCSGTARSVGELAQTLHDTAFAHAPDPIVTGEFRLGDVRHVFAHPGRAKERLGFVAHKQFEAGIGELAESPVVAA